MIVFFKYGTYPPYLLFLAFIDDQMRAKVAGLIAWIWLRSRVLMEKAHGLSWWYRMQLANVVRLTQSVTYSCLIQIGSWHLRHPPPLLNSYQTSSHSLSKFKVAPHPSYFDYRLSRTFFQVLFQSQSQDFLILHPSELSFTQSTLSITLNSMKQAQYWIPE